LEIAESEEILEVTLISLFVQGHVFKGLDHGGACCAASEESGYLCGELAEGLS
jgi:hypothetical protein